MSSAHTLHGGATGRWLAPSAALTRFAPAVRYAASVSRGRAVRYGVRLGDIGLLIGRDTLSEVIAQAAIYPIPNTPPWLAGLMNLRGNLVPVFDLHLLLGLEPPADRPRRFLLVLGRGDGAVGMYVDGLPQAVATGEGLGQLPPLPEVLREHVQTGYVDQGALWLEFPHEALFSTLGQRLGAARARRESVVPRADG